MEGASCGILVKIGVIHILLPGRFEWEDQVFRQSRHPVPLLPLIVLQVKGILGIFSLTIPQRFILVAHDCCW
jgi:hypothetical protein